MGSFGVLEFWSVEVLEYWSFGFLEFWSFGVLEFWSFVVLESWSFRVLRFMFYVLCFMHGLHFNVVNNRRWCNTILYSTTVFFSLLRALVPNVAKSSTSKPSQGTQQD